MLAKKTEHRKRIWNPIALAVNYFRRRKEETELVEKTLRDILERNDVHAIKDDNSGRLLDKVIAYVCNRFSNREILYFANKISTLVSNEAGKKVFDAFVDRRIGPI